ncbi:MAG: hypothetical protein ABSA72_06905 [Nitrososphaerales archaeon]|jgi:hypothetical protein
MVSDGDLRGHRVRARSGEHVLDSSTTDETGRFLLEWTGPTTDGVTVVELLDSNGAVTESVGLASTDLDSPPGVTFSGEGAGNAGASHGERDRIDGFDADGHYPVWVTPSCLEVTLSWTSPEGSRVSILRDWSPFREGLAHAGTLKVTDSSSGSYTRRTWLGGAGPDEFSDLTVEILRCPSLSLVVSGSELRTGGREELGASISCPAGDQGVTVRVRSSDQETVPDFEIRIPPGAVWATAIVQLGPKSGSARITGAAPGFAQDTVVLSTRQV